MFEGWQQISASHYFAFFLVGSILSLLLFKLISIDLARSFADLIWILAGGASVLSALLLSGYSADTDRAKREAADISREAILLTEETNRFNRNYCISELAPVEITVYDENRRLLCQSADYGQTKQLMLLGLRQLRPIVPELIPSEKEIRRECLRDPSNDKVDCLFGGNFFTGPDGLRHVAIHNFSEQELQFARQVVEEWNLQPGMSAEHRRLSYLQDEILLRFRHFQRTLEKIESEKNKVFARDISILALFFLFPFRILKSLSDFRKGRRITSK